LTDVAGQAASGHRTKRKNGAEEPCRAILEAAFEFVQIDV
jgi:hypothetical protein